MASPAKILGIDMGTKRIGLALSNAENTFAFPLKTLDVVQIAKNLQGIAHQIGVIAHENAVHDIVIGESKAFSGQENPIMEHVHAIKPMLEAQSFAVHLIPEFMTSAQPTRHQGETDHVDASAEAIILQTFLDKKMHAAKSQ